MKTGAVALVGFLCVTTACGGGGAGTAPSPTTSEQLSVARTTTHFRILAGTADAAVVRSVADALEANYPRITDDLRTGPLSTTDVWIWQDSASYYGDMQRTTGQVYQGSAGYLRGAHVVSLLVVSNTPLVAVHEFAHVASLAVNASFANNPRWLWETVALYENREFVRPDTLEYTRAGRFPTIVDLNSDYSVARQVYDVGYVLGEFIVSTWGMDGLLALIRANGRLEEVLSITTSEFEQRWYAWLRAGYLAVP